MLILVRQVLVTIFQCSPVSGFWNRIDGSQCNIDLRVFFASVSVINIVTDVVILALPMPYVIGLKRSAGQKVAVCGIFLTGSLCVLSSLSSRARSYSSNTSLRNVLIQGSTSQSMHYLHYPASLHYDGQHYRP